jgi:predicted ATPase/DNA-binding SARP family transcriptional activator
MEFGVLGPLILRHGDRDTTIGSGQQRRLLAALLVSAGALVSTDRLTAVLWGDEPPASAVPSLHTYVSRLRGLLHANGEEVLLTRPPGYLLSIDAAQTDAGRFEELLAAARALAADEPRAALARFDDALALWRGPAYAEFADAEFARAEAARLEELRLAATEERFDAELALGRHADLVGAIEAYADEHPLRERPRAQLMRALYRCGRQAEALAAFRAFRRRLDEDLGVEPSAALRDLETAILRQDAHLDWTPAAPVATHAVPSPPRTHGRLPGATSSLVGRERDVAAVAAALARCRLLTLTGMGGVGKTRLAVQSARTVADRYPDGAWFCELAPVTDGVDVCHAMATAVGATQQPGWSIEQSMLAFLATRRLLLVVDNCEHVLDDAARLAEAIVRDCPQVTVLATSRTALGVPGESVRPTAPLPVPGRGTGGDSSPAVQLFLDRARAVRPDLDLDETNLAHIADVCRGLDGLPLSIELAAARIRSLNPADLAERISDRFGLLTAPRSTMVARHRTLRAVVDWSYALLSPTEQRLLCRLSVFAGGFTLAAAEQVCAEDGLVDLLASLVDNSLVAVGSTARQVRYSMLETLRAYGSELLRARGELATLRRAHAEHYAAFAEQAARGQRGPDESRWTSALDADFDNLRAAHRWAVELGDADLALRLSDGLYYYVLGQFRDEVVSWGETALELPDAEAHERYSAVCGAVGEGLTLRGELHRARALAERALTGVTDPDDRRRIPVLKVLTAVALYEGRLDDCLDGAAEQLRLARQYDDAWQVAQALLYRGLARTYAGDPAGGLALADENLAAATALGNPSQTAWALYNQAEALSLSDPEAARRRYERAITLAESVNSTFAANNAEVGLAALLVRSGDSREALRAFRRTVHRWRRMQVWHHQWIALRNLVQLLVRIRAYQDAATLLGAVGAASTAAYGADADNLDQATDLLTHALGPPAFAVAAARGSAMNADTTVAFALAAIDRILD